MTGVEALEKELSAWTASDGTVPFWWRDDDLGNPTSALNPLLTAAEGLAMRPVLAAVPALTTPDLKKRLSGAPADIAVHGLAHIDHQAGRGKKAEFGDARPLAAGIADAEEGLKILRDRIGQDLLRCFVPPWNRMRPDLLEHLPELGYRGVSAFAGNRPHPSADGLIRADTHVDVIDWRGGRSFTGEAALANAIAAELAKRRVQRAKTHEPVGLLTHHLVMQDRDWLDFSRIIAMVLKQPFALILNCRDHFDPD